MTRDLIRIRWLSWLMGVLVLASVVYNCTGCSSFPLYRHVQLIKETKLNLDLIAESIAKNITVERVGLERAQAIVNIFNNVSEAQHFYVDAVKSYRKGFLLYSQKDLDDLFSELSESASELAIELAIYGVNIYKFVERIK